jgi:hypothetical protein
MYNLMLVTEDQIIDGPIKLDEMDDVEAEVCRLCAIFAKNSSQETYDRLANRDAIHKMINDKAQSSFISTITCTPCLSGNARRYLTSYSSIE